MLKIHVIQVAIICLLCLINCGSAQLLINVKNQGGDVVQETIFSNISDDAVTLEFQRSDGTLITQLVDFRNEVQILKALVLGEEERGQSQYQVMCFVTRFQKGEFISSDAMSKLRQKNPGTVRTPEEDRGRENYTMTGWMGVAGGGASRLSGHIGPLCAEAADSTYIRDEDLQAWATLSGTSLTGLTAGVKRFPASYYHPDVGNVLSADFETFPHCNQTPEVWKPCQCRLEMCIGWYPCGLKYCKGKGDAKSASMSYRCGIKTCKKCSLFSYYVKQKQQCLWDE